MKNEFGDDPIVREVNPHTGRLEGDDSGYRQVPISPYDAENPDPMVPVRVASRPIYAVGATVGLCTYYPGGLGGPSEMLVRAPVAHGLEMADQLLKPYNRKLLVVDAWRPWWIQAAIWAYLRAEIIKAEGLTDDQLSVFDEVRLGCKADDVGSYVAAVENDEFLVTKATLMTEKAEEIADAVAKLGKSADEVATLFLTFGANLKRNALRVQEDGITAHGGGGAVDLWLINTETGGYANLGVPFDYVPPPGIDVSPGVINYFELVEFEHYRALVARDKVLQQYLQELGIGEATQAVFEEARRERRLLYGAMMALGGSYFSLDKDLGEPWHFQLGNERGGRQSHIQELAGSGNPCHAILKGKKLACWGTAMGHKLAKEWIGHTG